MSWGDPDFSLDPQLLANLHCHDPPYFTFSLCNSATSAHQLHSRNSHQQPPFPSCSHSPRLLLPIKYRSPSKPSHTHIFTSHFKEQRSKHQQTSTSLAIHSHTTTTHITPPQHQSQTPPQHQCHQAKPSQWISPMPSPRRSALSRTSSVLLVPISPLPRPST